MAKYVIETPNKRQYFIDTDVYQVGCILDDEDTPLGPTTVLLLQNTASKANTRLVIEGLRASEVSKLLNWNG